MCRSEQRDATCPRIHVLLARDARVGVIIRRGPSKHVCTIGWDRQKDKFSIGQWLKGRIYERRSDISPDGRYLIYFALNGKWEAQTGGSWTAISRAPYLKALGLWAKGDGWHGGGLFGEKSTFWLNDGYGHTQLRSPPRLRRVDECPQQNEFGGECPGVYYLRLQRDGWKLVSKGKSGGRSSIAVFEKRLRSGWTLRKLAHETVDHPIGKGCYYDEHALVKSDKMIKLSDWEWADLDGRRLVWSEGGKLFSGHVSESGLGKPKELYNFTDMSFKAIAAPY